MNTKQLLQVLSRYLGLVMLVVSTLVGGFMIWKYVLPKYQEIQIVRAELITEREKKDTLTSYIAYLRQLETTTLPIEEALVNYALPSENDVLSLIITYEGLSKTEGMDVSPFEFSPGLIQRKEETSNNGNTAEVIGGEIPDSSGGTKSHELEFDMEAKTKTPEIALDFINKIHKTRRVFTIKSLNWQNPVLNTSTEDEDIDIQMSLTTNYYESSPSVSGSTELVNKGKTQEEFISKLNDTTVFDDLVLDTVEVGKEDFFEVEGVARPTPTKVASPSATITSAPAAF